MPLLIVESPTKAKTLSKFLGKEYRVISSFGHIRDLPEKEFGVDIEKNFQPTYTILPKAKKIVARLKEEVKKTEKVILATDEDREGEAIAWHLKEVLNLKNPQRIVFHEITKSAINEALKSPRSIDMNLVSAQQARRILDRIVGYKLSPFLWEKVAKGLSAGRVQSVAVRLIVEREREIENFVPAEYWKIKVFLEKKEADKNGLKEFEAILVKKDGEKIPLLEIKNKEEAEKIIKKLEGAIYQVANLEKKEVKKNPFPPFTTSTLQQTAWQRFRFPAKLTMKLAQELYERGYITYHRTDSLNLSLLSLASAKNFIIKTWGEEYWAGKFIRYKTKSKTSQEAHEAIRPTFVEKTPQSLKLNNPQLLKLYTLIWQRFIACQMASAIFDFTKVDVKAKNYVFESQGQILKFPGFLKVYPLQSNEKKIPKLEKKEKLNLIEIRPLQYFTQPPPRYTEATLIKTLEKYGIGRPSTYAPIISTIQERNYVVKDKNQNFVPTEIGILVNDLLVNNFSKVVDIDFTAKMETELDKIAEGKKEWQKVCQDFWIPFSQNLEEKYLFIKKTDFLKETNKTCPLCKAPLKEKLGRFGKFYACSNFPHCKYKESLTLSNNKEKIKCPQCQKGEIVAKRTKKGQIFYGCSNYPNCNFALWDEPINELCPKCNSLLIKKFLKNEKSFIIKCSNRNCDFKKDG